MEPFNKADQVSTNSKLCDLPYETGEKLKYHSCVEGGGLTRSLCPSRSLEIWALQKKAYSRIITHNRSGIALKPAGGRANSRVRRSHFIGEVMTGWNISSRCVENTVDQSFPKQPRHALGRIHASDSWIKSWECFLSRFGRDRARQALWIVMNRSLYLPSRRVILHPFRHPLLSGPGGRRPPGKM